MSIHRNNRLAVNSDYVNFAMQRSTVKCLVACSEGENQRSVNDLQCTLSAIFGLHSYIFPK